MKAYISSTYSELREYRKSAFDSMMRMGVQVVAMEHFAASVTPPVEQCIQAIRACDLCVLILGHRYGFVPEGYNKSMTQLEYEEARARGIPILVFVLSDEVPVKPSMLESDFKQQQRMHSFKSQVRSELVAESFTSSDDLSAKLVAALHTFLETRPKPSKSTLEKKLAECQEESERYKKVIDDLSAKLTRIVPADPIWRGRNFERDHLLCFSLLPFSDDFFEVYESAIAPAAKEVGLRALHAGEIFDNREIVEDIWDSICAARIIVADVTGRNPNVFYELGICHTLGKECIIITQEKEDVPFDIRHRRFIEYKPDKLASLRSRLRKTIQTIISRVSLNTDEDAECS